MHVCKMKLEDLKYFIRGGALLAPAKHCNPPFFLNPLLMFVAACIILL